MFAGMVVGVNDVKGKETKKATHKKKGFIGSGLI